MADIKKNQKIVKTKLTVSVKANKFYMESEYKTKLWSPESSSYCVSEKP